MFKRIAAAPLRSTSRPLQIYLHRRCYSLLAVRSKGVFSLSGSHSSTCIACQKAVGCSSTPGALRYFSSLPDHIMLDMPALSPTMEKGNIAAWVKAEGDEVACGEVMAEVETDKATVAFESTEDGFLAKILLSAGAQDVAVGTPVAILVENEEDIAAFANYSGEGASAAETTPPAVEEPSAPTPVAPATTAAPAATSSAPVQASASSGRVVASPRARMAATEKGVDISQVAGTGPGHRIVEADVREFVPSAAAAANVAAPATPAASTAFETSPDGDFIDIPNTQIRKITAARLTESKTTIPHYYLTSEINMDKVLAVRKELNTGREKANSLSVNDFLIKAASLACQKVPDVNSSWSADSIRQYNYVDVCVAVSTPTGLITPIVKDADIKGLDEIGANVKDLASRARENKLKPEEFMGGTFTISNLGMFGIESFSAIINPPQAAILAVGTTKPRVVATVDAEGNQTFKSSSFMNVTISLDHRVVDGAVGAKWLQEFKKFCENPISMLC